MSKASQSYKHQAVLAFLQQLNDEASEAAKARRAEQEKDPDWQRLFADPEFQRLGRESKRITRKYAKLTAKWKGKLRDDLPPDEAAEADRLHAEHEGEMASIRQAIAPMMRDYGLPKPGPESIIDTTEDLAKHIEQAIRRAQMIAEANGGSIGEYLGRPSQHSDPPPMDGRDDIRDLAYRVVDADPALPPLPERRDDPEADVRALLDWGKRASAAPAEVADSGPPPRNASQTPGIAAALVTMREARDAAARSTGLHDEHLAAFGDALMAAVEAGALPGPELAPVRSTLEARRYYIGIPDLAKRLRSRKVSGRAEQFTAIIEAIEGELAVGEQRAEAAGTTDQHGGDDADDEQPPALTPDDQLVLATLEQFDPSQLVGVERISEAMEYHRAERVIRDAINRLIAIDLAERPHGKRRGARLTSRGRRLAVKIAD